jgi:hypothetical protein
VQCSPLEALTRASAGGRHLWVPKTRLCPESARRVSCVLTYRVSDRGAPLAGDRSVVSPLVAATTTGAGGTALSLWAGEGDRDPAAPSSASGIGASGRSSATESGGSGASGGARLGVAAASVEEVVVRDSRNTSGLASAAGLPPVDVSASPSGQAGDGEWDPGACRAACT